MLWVLCLIHIMMENKMFRSDKLCSSYFPLFRYMCEIWTKSSDKSFVNYPVLLSMLNVYFHILTKVNVCWALYFFFFSGN